jgi:hypothetical protein
LDWEIYSGRIAMPYLNFDELRRIEREVERTERDLAPIRAAIGGLGAEVA